MSVENNRNRLHPHNKAKHIQQYGRALYLGALYAGGFVGLKDWVKKLDTIGM